MSWSIESPTTIGLAASKKLEGRDVWHKHDYVCIVGPRCGLRVEQQLRHERPDDAEEDAVLAQSAHEV